MSDGVRRVVAEEIASAILIIEDRHADPDDVIHEVRKHCKKIRGALRLVRGSFEQYGPYNRRVRDLARNLSPLRAAHVLRGSHRELSAPIVNDRNRAGLQEIRDALNERVAVDDDEVANALVVAREELLALAGDVPGWKIAEGGFGSIADGVHRTFKRARKAEQRCRNGASDGELHEFRKRVKYHWYHMRLLVKSWPRVVKARQVAAHHLSSLLGDDHDLADYLRELDAVRAEVSKPLTRHLSRQAAAQRRLLQQQSRAIGNRLFADKPQEFARVFESYWTAWQESDTVRLD